MPLRLASEVLAEMEARKPNPRYVENWREELEQGSRWWPGCPGDPDCKVCEGTGYLRLDLPLDHPDFGQIFLCDCSKPFLAEHGSGRVAGRRRK